LERQLSATDGVCTRSRERDYTAASGGTWELVRIAVAFKSLE
jgi:hypothetical protein